MDAKVFRFEATDDRAIAETIARARSAMQVAKEQATITGTPAYVGPTVIPRSAAIMMVATCRAHDLRDALRVGFGIIGVGESDRARLATLDDRAFAAGLLAVLRGDDLGEALAEHASSTRQASILGEGGGR